MATRRQFIATTAAAAITVSVPATARGGKAPPAAPGGNDQPRPETATPDGELTRYNTLAALAQSVPFPDR